jgi:short-subunit dehydrogenase
MGEAVARNLASRGANIILVARDVGKLEAALEKVKVNPPQKNILQSFCSRPRQQKADSSS